MKSVFSGAALAVAGIVGPLLSATDSTEMGLAAAAVNDRLRKPGWCKCQPDGQQAYFRLSCDS